MMSFKIEELDLKDDTAQEQVRTRKIFEDLKEKANKGEELTEYEKDFFCLGVKLSTLDDGKIEDYECCKNYIYKDLYLVYFKDLLGYGVYEKAKGLSSYKVGTKEIARDIKYLANEEREWLNTINIQNHTDALLQQSSIEARNELKNLDDNSGNLIFNKEKTNYKRSKRSLLLQSKFIYLKAMIFFEKHKKDDLILKLNGNDIEINEYSIIHILSRHFAQITKPSSNKSFHHKDFSPDYINMQLKSIFKDIDKSGFLIGSSLNKIFFNYKKTDYTIWINERTKQEKGVGNVKYNRLETFYPVTDASELSQLKKYYKFKAINSDLGVYVKK